MRRRSPGRICAVFCVAWAPAFAGEVEVSLTALPAEVLMGQPFVLTLDCEHDAGLVPRISVLDLGVGWWNAGPSRRVTRDLDGAPGRALTQVRWSLVSIEVGSHELQFAPGLIESSLAPLSVELPPVFVTILGELAEGEDTPRDLVGFRPPPGEGPAPLGPAGALVALAFVSLMGFSFLVRRARNRGSQVSAQPQSASAALLALDPDLVLGPGESGRARELFALAVLAVRESIDRRVGQDLTGCSDEEWIARRSPGSGLDAEQLTRASELLRSAEAVKYAQGDPTRWALGDCLTSARALVQDESTKSPEVAR